MSRWEPDAPGRLAQAALELFHEHGFDQATAAGIAARAGVTERTFYRHFVDKREVLFSGSGQLQDLLVEQVASADPGLSPLDAVCAALGAAGPFFAERREQARLRQRVIAANPELQERELIKLARLSVALADVLRRRGVADPAAALAAEAGVAVFSAAFARWIADPEQDDFARLVGESLVALRTVTAPG